MNLNPVRTGVVLGAVLGLWHLIWSVCVALGWAQTLVDFVLWLHFMKVPVEVQPFHPGVAAILVGVTALVGFLVGGVFAAIWNWLHRT